MPAVRTIKATKATRPDRLSRVSVSNRSRRDGNKENGELVLAKSAKKKPTASDENKALRAELAEIKGKRLIAHLPKWGAFTVELMTILSDHEGRLEEELKARKAAQRQKKSKEKAAKIPKPEGAAGDAWSIRTEMGLDNNIPLFKAIQVCHPTVKEAIRLRLKNAHALSPHPWSTCADLVERDSRFGNRGPNRRSGRLSKATNNRPCKHLQSSKCTVLK
jgi:hypothetical protein